MTHTIARWMALTALAAGAAWGQLTVTVSCKPAQLPRLIQTTVSVACTASGGLSPYTWSITAGTLPPGLSLNSSGNITGTLEDPAGPYSFSVTATDSTPILPLSGSFPFSGTTVDPLTLSCTLSTGPVEVGILYANTCTAGGGTPPYGWSIGGTSVPPGLTVPPTGNPATINYTPTSPLASYQYGLVLTDSSTPQLTKGQTFSGSIASPPGITTTSPLPAGAVGTAYSQQFAAGSGVPPYTWSATGLPSNGLSLNVSGLLQGTPASGGPMSFNVIATDSVGGTSGAVPFTLSVLGITTTSPLPAATIGAAYSQTFSATGGTAPYTWSISGQPAWLAMSPAGVLTSTGSVPASALTSSFTVKLTDSASNSTSAPFTLPVTPVIATTTLPAATIGTNYSETLAAEGGTGTYTWAVTTGSLPAGLTLSTAGALTGTPGATAQTSTFTVTVTDSSKATASAPLTLAVNLAITTTSPLTAATIGTAYNVTLTATGGAGGYTWAVTTGSLPAGLTLSTGGALTGTPAASAQDAGFTVTVTDKSNATASAPFTLPVNLAITTTNPLGNGAVGTAYNQTLAGVGGLAPYTWSTTVGTLPAGLSLTASGTISGTPSAAGTSQFTVQLSDHATPADTPATKVFSITIGGGLTITTTTLPNATVGIAYSQTLAAAGGAPPYTWSITTGALPAPLTLSPSGTIGGTPAAASTTNFTVTVTDSAGTTFNQPLTLVVVTPPSITTTSLPNATAGVSYSQTLSATGGTSPYKWAVSSGGLPGGLTLSTAGAITGTPTSAGTASFTVQLTDATGVTASQKLTLAVISTLTISTTSPLPGGEVGVTYSQTLAATGGTPPYTWSVTAGALPAGLTLSTSGALTGTPSTAGAFNFTAQATDSNHVTASAPFTLAIAGPLGISTAPTLSSGSVNSNYSQNLAASGGVTPYAWALVGGTLPPGLTLSGSGAITGVPVAAGTFPFTAKVTDALGATTSRQFTIAIVSGLTISSPTTLPGATVGVSYSYSFLASGGATPYIWAILNGAPPSGLTLQTNGTLAGTPTTAGSVSFTVQVTDSQGHKASEPVSITVSGALSITTSALPGGAAGAGYSQSLAASGGTPPYVWSLAGGALPGGLSLSAAGAISGTINTTGTFTFTVEVTDSLAATATKQLSIAVPTGLAITTTAALPNATLNAAYSQTLAAVGGTPPYTWSVTSGALPAGLTLSAAGAITGTPTSAGTFSFTAVVKDSASASAAQQFTLIVAGGLTITTTSLPGGKAGTPYSQVLAASGGTPPYTFARTSGSLPPGIALSGATLSGTPTTTGSYTFTVQVTDSASATATQQFTIAITGLAITTAATLPSAAVGTAYSVTLAAAGTPPYTWSAQGALPAGLTLDASSGTISGTPTAGGSSSVTIQVTDSTQATASTDFTLFVLSGSFTGISGTVTSDEQLSGTVAPGAAYPADITGQIALSFEPAASLSAPSDDPSILFSSGGVTSDFTIPANSTTPVPFSLQTGTVAGTITLTVSWQSGGPLAVPVALTQTIQIAPAAPVISAITATTTSTGFQVQITGYSNTRELTQALLQFAPAAGQTLQTTSLTVSLSSAAATWFQSGTSDQYGSQFILTLPFTVSNGGSSAIGSISVQLQNSVGSSSSSSATL